eukprot:12055709-Ditylum_brightwellii.AAC.1
MVRSGGAGQDSAGGILSSSFFLCHKNGFEQSWDTGLGICIGNTSANYCISLGFSEPLDEKIPIQVVILLLVLGFDDTDSWSR